jgi:hypothetical protein
MHDAVYASITFERGSVQNQTVADVVEPDQSVLRVFQRHAADDAMDSIASGEKRCGQV